MGYKRMAVAMGVGYVLGAKAGEKRYEQLKDLWERATDSLSDSEFLPKLRDAATRAADRGREALMSSGRDDDQESFDDQEPSEDEEPDEAMDASSEEPDDEESMEDESEPEEDEDEPYEGGDQYEVVDEDEEGEPEEDGSFEAEDTSEEPEDSDEEPDEDEEDEEQPERARSRSGVRPARRSAHPNDEEPDHSSDGAGLAAVTRRFLERGRVA